MSLGPNSGDKSDCLYVNDSTGYGALVSGIQRARELCLDCRRGEVDRSLERDNCVVALKCRKKTSCENIAVARDNISSNLLVYPNNSIPVSR